MKYTLSNRFDTALVRSKIMGPNPLKLQEELLLHHAIPENGLVLDLGSGQGITSVMLAREYGFTVYAADLWSDPGENLRFFASMGLSPRQLMPIKADATALPFPTEVFDAVVCTDSYNYFGRDPHYLGEKLLPFVKPGGYIYIAVPGMKKDCHDCLPEALRLSWTGEQLDYLHDTAYWRSMVSGTKGAQVLAVEEMEGNEELWADWLACDNDYAHADKKAIDAGACAYLNFIRIVIKKR